MEACFLEIGEPKRHGFLDLPDKEREKVPEVLAKVRPASSGAVKVGGVISTQLNDGNIGGEQGKRA